MVENQTTTIFKINGIVVCKQRYVCFVVFFFWFVHSLKEYSSVELSVQFQFICDVISFESSLELD